MLRTISPSVRKFVGYQALSILGDRIAQVSVPLALLGLTGSPSAAGAAAAANQLPGFLVAISAGRAVDRWSRKTISVLCDAGRAALYLLLGLLFFLEPVNVALVVGLMFLIGVLDTVAGIAHFSWLPSLARERELMRANELLEGSDAAVTVLGPPIGGVLLDALGRAFGVLVNAVTFGISALGLSTLPADSRLREVSPESTGSGFKAILTDRNQWSVQLMLSGTYVTTGALVLITLTMADRVLGLSASAASLAISGAGVGGLLAAFLLAPRLRRIRLRFVCFIMYLVVSLALMLVSQAGGLAALVLAMVCADAAVTLTFIVLATVRQSVTEERQLGRIAGTSTTLNALIVAIAAASAGLAMGSIGVRETAAAWAALMVPALIGAWTLGVGTGTLEELESASTTTRFDGTGGEDE